MPSGFCYSARLVWHMVNLTFETMVVLFDQAVELYVWVELHSNSQTSCGKLHVGIKFGTWNVRRLKRASSLPRVTVDHLVKQKTNLLNICNRLVNNQFKHK